MLVKELGGVGRHEILGLLKCIRRDDLVGLELGVARGGFARQMLQTGRFKHYVGVDAYNDEGRSHDVYEYQRALTNCGVFSELRLLRMTFQDALPLFPDGTFDFIYIDGYAHIGPEVLMEDWWPKLGPGGLFAGDDYTKRWPAVQRDVNAFAEERDLDVFVTDAKANRRRRYGRSPSWCMLKPE